MSSSVKPATQTKASNPSVSLANAWSKGPPQTTAASNSSRAQSPASNAPPGTHSRRQSTLGPNAGQGAVKPVTIGRGVTGAGHRPTNSISFGSVDATPVPAPAPAPATPTEKAKQPDPVPAAPSPSIAAPQPPASAPASAATPAQPPAQAPEPAPALTKVNGVKVVAPTPTQPAPASNTSATTTPSAASTPPASTSTPKPKKALNVHALFQGGGSTPAAPAVAPQTPASAPVQPPAPSAPTGPNAPRGPGYTGRDAVPFPRSPQIPRPPLAGTQSGSGGPRPAGSPRMGGASMPVPHHQQHHPQHAPHMQPQWGQQPYYYQPQGFDPYMHHYWPQQHHPHSPHPHQHPHMPPHMHNPPMQPSPRLPSAPPRPPSTPPVSTTSPHPPAPGHAPPPISTHVHNPATPSVPSPATVSQLNTSAAAFVPGMRPRSSIRISTPDGSAVSFEGTVPPSPKVSIGVGQGGGPAVSLPKRQSVRLESAEEKAARLAKEKEEKEKKEREEREKKEEKERLEREAKEKEEREREEKERKEREEKEAKERAEREERERLEREAREKEEQERKEREEKERLEREEKERIEREKAEAEARAKAEEEARLKAEAEAKAKAEAEAKAKEEAEAKARAEAEAAAAAAAAAEAKAKEEAEAAAKAKAEAEEQARAEAEAKAKAEAEAAATAAEARDTISPVESPKPTSNGLLPSTIPERPSPLSISTTASERPKRPVPGPLDLSSAQGNRSAAPPSALASARIIEDLNAVPYPEAIKTPNPDLNIAATPGKFRYDREFLLQFMNVCKEKPDSLPPLDAIGLEPGEQSAAGYQGGARQSGRRINSIGMSGAPGMQRQGSTGNVSLPKTGSMGVFQAPFSRLGDSQTRFEASTTSGRGAAGIPFPPGTTGRLTITRSTSQGGVGGPGGLREAKRTRSQRGGNRGDSMRAGGYQTPANQTMASFEHVAPLEQSENRWVAGSTQRTPQQIEARALVDRKVKSLLNKLTMDKFDSISDQIIEWANKSEQEKDGSTLMQVIKLIFEKAKDEAGFSEMYARLCRKMMERVSPNVQDETIRNPEGQPITGGLLFRKYLLNRCQEDFERGWSAKEAAAALAASKAGDDKAAEAAGQASGEAVLYSEEYYAAAKAKRQGLGLVRFIGELFKLQMLTERIMHECIKKLLSNVVNPEEEEIESLCKLLTTVGQSLDNAKARNHMDIYFERMQEMARGSNINSRMQFMLQDVIELRLRHWQTRSAVAQPSTIAAVHEQAKRDEAASRNAMQRGGSRRGEYRGDHGQQADGWNVAGGASAARPPAKAGDLSQFGKISKPTGLSFGPTSVFNKKDPKQRDASLSRASSNVNMFAALGAAGADGPPQPEAAAGRGGASSRKPSMDLGPSGAPAVERKRLNLLPRTKPTETEADKGEDDATPEPAAASAPMSEADAQKKVKEDIKEYLGVENVEEAILALEALPTEHRHIFVDKMVGAALNGGNRVVVLAENLFAAIHKQQACSAEAFERGLLPTVEMADDMSIDVPKTYEWLARLMHSAGIDRVRVEELAGKISVLGEPRVQPRDLLMQEFDKLSA
ncbi:hypothetical protein FRC06_004447 [Ceratobasidium sp. 370]|nr:hypothetical protein FRC06_004447 [Ceratobasidium sp. 370]